MLSADNAFAHPVLGDGQQEKAGPEAQVQSDALLQASRRLDWRFLLPDPNLGRVAYLGPANKSLWEALRLFSAALAVIEGNPTQDGRAVQFDVVVASRPSYDLLEWAAELVRPRGFLYVEAYRRLWPSRLRFPADYVSAIRRLGFVEVEAHWHWPNFEACAEIVPLDDPAALLHALGRRRSGGAARLKSAIGRRLLRMGLLTQIVPCFSLVAQKRVRDESQ
jgi:hypothetical protein